MAVERTMSNQPVPGWGRLCMYMYVCVFAASQHDVTRVCERGSDTRPSVRPSRGAVSSGLDRLEHSMEHADYARFLPTWHGRYDATAETWKKQVRLIST